VINIPYALWNERTILCFDEEGTSGSKVSGRGRSKVRVDSIDNIHFKDKVSFIKMDIEGAEMNALKGAEKVILRDKPDLAICIYHRFEDLIEIPMYVKQLLPEYKLYVRHHSDRSIETVLYATVNTR